MKNNLMYLQKGKKSKNWFMMSINIKKMSMYYKYFMKYVNQVYKRQ